MIEPLESFEAFLSIWFAENVGPLGGHTDSSDWNFIMRRRADELVEAATIKGFYGELVEAAKPYGGVEGFVRKKFKEASERS